MIARGTKEQERCRGLMIARGSKIEKVKNSRDMVKKNKYTVVSIKIEKEHWWITAEIHVVYHSSSFSGQAAPSKKPHKGEMNAWFTVALHQQVFGDGLFPSMDAPFGFPS